MSRAAFLEFLNDSVMGSTFTRYKSPAFVHLDYTPTFTPVLLRKDFDLGLAAARELDVPMPVAAATAQLVQAPVSGGRVDEDFAMLLDQQAARVRAGAHAGGHAGRRRARRGAGVTRRPPRGRWRRPGTWASTTRRGSTSTGCASTGWPGPRQSLEASGCGAFLLFDFYNIRYTTQTWIGGALGDKMTRYALLTRDGGPTLWDFGSAARHHKLYSPWLAQDDCRAGMLGLRGAIAPTAGLMEDAVREIKGMLDRRRAWPTSRSASTSSSRRSCSRCSGRA